MGRAKWVDITKGILSILVIIGHTVGNSFIIAMIYSFHMPCFFILSGYTYKTISHEDIQSYILRCFKKLIVPCIFLSIIQCIVNIYHGMEIKQALLYHALGLLFGDIKEITFMNYKGCAMGILWFMFAMFWAKVIYSFVQIFITTNRTIFIAFLSLLGYSIAKFSCVPQSIDIALVSLIYIEVGYLYKEYKHKFNQYSIVIGLLCCFMWVCYANSGFSLAFRAYVSVLALYVIPFCGSVCTFQLSEALESMRISGILSFIGKNSFYVYMIHYLELNYIYIYMMGLPRHYNMIIRVIFCVLILYIYIFCKNGINQLIHRK